MATEPLTFKVFANMGDALRDLGLATKKTAEAFAHMMNAFDPMWAILPGEWPDNFTLLNRYVRTGVRPRFLIND